MDKVLCLGDIGIDHYIREKKFFVGGCAYNLHYHLSNLNISNTLMSLIGEDQWSDVLKQKCPKAKFYQVSSPNLVLHIENTPSGEKLYGEYDDALLRSNTLPVEALDSIGEYELVISPYFVEIRNLLKGVLNSFPKKIVLDLHDEELLSQADFISLSKTVKAIHTGVKNYTESFYIEASKECEFISVTLGARGSELYVNGRKILCKIDQAQNVVDSTGAGDAYLAYLISSLGTSFGENTLKQASLYARETIKYFGATPNSQVKSKESS